MALFDRHLYRAPYLLTFFQPSFTRNEPNKSTPVYVNGVSSPILSFGKCTVFSCWSLPLKFLHLTHFKMIYLTKKLNLVTQKTRGPYLVHCHASTSMSYLLMTPAHYQLYISAVFWQQYWMLHVVCQCWSLNPYPQLLIFFDHQWMELTLHLHVFRV